MVIVQDVVGCKGCKHSLVEKSYSHYCKLTHCDKREGIDCRECEYLVTEVSESVACKLNIMLPVVSLMIGRCDEREERY